MSGKLCSLAERLYVLAYDFDKERLVGGSYFEYVLRAGVLAELFLDGAIRDENGKAIAVRNSSDSTAPMIAETLRAIVESPGKSWRYWLRQDVRATHAAVADRLVADGVIRLHGNKILGVVSTKKVTVVDGARVGVKRLAQHAKRALGGQSTSMVEPFDAAIIALAAAGELTTLVDRRQRRECRERIDQFIDIVGPIPESLRRLIRGKRAARMSGGG